MANIDAATEKRLDETLSYLKYKSDDKLMVRLYQKILFLIELNYYKKHSKLFIGLDFVSYKFGPFSLEIAQALENPARTNYSKEVKEKVDEVLNEYKLHSFDIKTMKKAYQKMIDYIHSLLIYNMTPFNHSLNFNHYQFEDLFQTIHSNLNGEELEQEKSYFAQIKQEAKDYECLFQT